MLNPKPNEKKLSLLYDQELNGTERKNLWEQLKGCEESQKIMDEFKENSKKINHLLNSFSPGNGFANKIMEEIYKSEKVFR